MLFIYNFLSTLLLIALSPLLLSIIVLRQGTGSRIISRLGFGLKRQLNSHSQEARPDLTFWIHALSVGEVTSAVPLVQGLKRQYPNSRVIFSATTKSGLQIARHNLSSEVDCIIPSPLDLLWTVSFFIRSIQPDLFVLVETDFWPNWLRQLEVKKVPTILVNGRISGKSLSRYQRFAFFFASMFRCFSKLSMQTTADAAAMAKLGIPPQRLVTLGNLKYDRKTSQQDSASRKALKTLYGFSEKGLLWICGSTHEGEEEIILSVFARLCQTTPELQIMIAPRDIGRADQIASLAEKCGLTWCRRTQTCTPPYDLMILDTIGELASCYAMADVVFIGGSLVPAGGHNPIEPASFGVPVLFGEHMEDFAEISEDLLHKGGALMVTGMESMMEATSRLFSDPVLRQATAGAGKQWVAGHRGVIDNHLTVIQELLSPSPP